MWVKAFTPTLRVHQGDPMLNICNKSSEHLYASIKKGGHQNARLAIKN